MHRQGLRRDERPDVASNPESQRWIYVGMEKPTRVDCRVRVIESGPGRLASEVGITEGGWRMRYPNQNPELPLESYVTLGELVPLRASVSSSIKWDILIYCCKAHLLYSKLPQKLVFKTTNISLSQFLWVRNPDIV